MADKMTLYTNGYVRGLEAAAGLAKEGGFEAIEKEISFRGKVGNHLPVRNSEILKAAERIKKNTVQTVTALCMLSLHDEFGFGKKRLEQFMNRFWFKVDCMGDEENLFCWEDVRDILMKECGIDLELKIIEEDERFRRKENAK